MYCRLKKYRELKLKLPNVISTGITETAHIMLIEIAGKVSFPITCTFHGVTFLRRCFHSMQSDKMIYTNN